MIEVENLTKTYGPTVAVDGISFQIPKGEVVGFLGPNGAGKTTTMRILTCYLPADSGAARVAGYDTFTEPVEVRRRIGYLPESAPVYAELGIVEYLQFVAEIRGIPKSERESRIARAIERTALGPMIHKDIGQLSKGYRQRVGLAATLIHDPEVLVLDEPTTGLDPNQIIEIRQLIREIGREKTVILSTHILPEVEATCDRVLIINQGRIVASGTPAELTRAAEGKVVCRVGFRAEPAIVEPALRAAPGIEELLPLDTGTNGTCRYEISSREHDIAERVFHLAVGNGWTLNELHTERLSLEQVFTQLTLGDK
ncbi:MAG: ATP-binding cassette domain-containing protein [Candidatus Eisenbacteria bacterium]